jgi:hypothetical protein
MLWRRHCRDCQLSAASSWSCAGHRQARAPREAGARVACLPQAHLCPLNSLPHHQPNSPHCSVCSRGACPRLRILHPDDGSGNPFWSPQLQRPRRASLAPAQLPHRPAAPPHQQRHGLGGEGGCSGGGSSHRAAIAHSHRQCRHRWRRRLGLLASAACIHGFFAAHHASMPTNGHHLLPAAVDQRWATSFVQLRQLSQLQLNSCLGLGPERAATLCQLNALTSLKIFRYECVVRGGREITLAHAHRMQASGADLHALPLPASADAQPSAAQR